jgi:hypothetical protein
MLMGVIGSFLRFVSVYSSVPYEKFRIHGRHDNFRRRPSLLDADVNEIVVPTSIDAPPSLSITHYANV